MTYIQEKTDDTGDLTMEQMMSENSAINGYSDVMMNGDDEDASMLTGSPEEILKMKITKQIDGNKFAGQKLLVAAVPKLPVRHSWAKAQRFVGQDVSFVFVVLVVCLLLLLLFFFHIHMSVRKRTMQSHFVYVCVIK